MKKNASTTFPLIQLNKKTAVDAVCQLSEKQAVEQSKFYAALLDVICSQLLPQAVASTFIAGAVFSIEQQIQDGSCNPKTKKRVLPSASMTLTCSLGQTVKSAKQDSDILFDIRLNPIDLNEYVLPTRSHRRLALQLRLLAGIFSGDEIEVGLESQREGIRSLSALSLITSDYMNACVSFKLKKFRAIEDLLAAMLADGLDLTALQPFMAVA